MLTMTVELGVVIGKTGRDISKADAESYIAGYSEFLLCGRTIVFVSKPQLSSHIQALAVDLTARNVQDAVKKKGLPWSTAKGFDTFCPVG